MSSQHYRLLIALGNLLLVLGLAWVGFRAFRPPRAAANEAPPADFQPTRYDIRSEGIRRSTVEEHRVTWSQLDRPPKPPPPVVQAPPPQPAAPAQPTPMDLSRMYTLVLASYDENNPRRSSCIIQAGGGQRLLWIGDNLDGYRILEIKVQGEGDRTEAIVTVESQGTQHTIRWTRKPQG